MSDERHAIARDAAGRLHAEYERIRGVRHAQGNHATRVQVNTNGADSRVNDLTQQGAKRVLGGPELAGVLEDLRVSPQRAATILLRRTGLLKLLAGLVRHQGALWDARGEERLGRAHGACAPR